MTINIEFEKKKRCFEEVGLGGALFVFLGRWWPTPFSAVLRNNYAKRFGKLCLRTLQGPICMYTSVAANVVDGSCSIFVLQPGTIRMESRRHIGRPASSGRRSLLGWVLPGVAGEGVAGWWGGEDCGLGAGFGELNTQVMNPPLWHSTSVMFNLM